MDGMIMPFHLPGSHSSRASSKPAASHGRNEKSGKGSSAASITSPRMVSVDEERYDENTNRAPASSSKNVNSSSSRSHGQSSSKSNRVRTSLPKGCDPDNEDNDESGADKSHEDSDDSSAPKKKKNVKAAWMSSVVSRGPLNLPLLKVEGPVHHKATSSPLGRDIRKLINAKWEETSVSSSTHLSVVQINVPIYFSPGLTCKHVLQLKLSFQGSLQDSLNPENNYVLKFMIQRYDVPPEHHQKLWEYTGRLFRF